MKGYVEYAPTGQSWRMGVWVDCRKCFASGRIIGSAEPGSEWADASMQECKAAFVSSGWTGEGHNLLDARCPKCNGRSWSNDNQ